MLFVLSWCVSCGDMHCAVRVWCAMQMYFVVCHASVFSGVHELSMCVSGLRVSITGLNIVSCISTPLAFSSSDRKLLILPLQLEI